MGYIDKAVNWAVAIAKDDSYAYVYGGWGKSDGGYDCSHFVITAWEQAGVGVKSAGAASTENMYSVFTAKGFQDVTSSCNLSTGSGMKKGDVLLRLKSSGKDGHAAMVQSSGKIIEAKGRAYGIVESEPYRNASWRYVLRYPEASGTKTTLPAKSTIPVPSGLGKYYVYETWNREEHGMSAWREGSNQKKLIDAAKSAGVYSFDKSGYGKIGERYVVAVTSTFGDVGDYIDIYCADGTTYKAVIGDIKNQGDAGCTKWGHSNGQVVVEWMTNWAASPVHKNRNSDGGIIKIVNYGSYFTYPEYAKDGYVSPEDTGGTSGTSKSITQQQNVASYGEQAAIRLNEFEGRKSTLAPDTELYIIAHDGTIYKPMVADGITWETSYSGAPGQLTFTVIPDENISFFEGSQVVFKYKTAPLFYGFIFTKKRDKDGGIECIAYDQIRYMQNKTSLVYSDKTATEVIQMLARDFSLQTGVLEDTVEKIPLRVEDNSAALDIIEYALDYTANRTGVWYVFYDDFGKLTLRKSTDMTTDCVIVKGSMENYNYTTSIGESTYTRIRKYYDNKDTGIKEIYSYDESAAKPYYGVLQLLEKIDDTDIADFRANAEELMKNELAQYAAPTRTLELSGVEGDVTVRGGSPVNVALDLGDITVNSEESGVRFVCDSVKHSFSGGRHSMDVNLTGGGYRFV